MNTIRILVIALFFTACCPSQKVSERKIKRLTKCNPALIKKDTVSVLDTIITESIKHQKDTVLKHDTLVVNNKGARVLIVRKDTIKEEIPIYVEVECPSDTIYREVKVPVESISVPERGTSKWHWALYALILGFVLGLFLMVNKK